MELRYIESFLAVVKYKNFSEAAASLYISQSSLSKNIKKIEDKMDVRLFERTMTGTSLTKYGKIYLKYARQIKDLESRCDNLIHDQKLKQNALNIGTIPSASEYGILNAIFDFANSEHIKVRITNNTSGELEKDLLDGKLDLAFIKNPENKNLSSVNYEHDQLMAIISDDNPLSKKSSIKISELKNQDFILEPINSRPYTLCVNLCKKAGFTPNVIYADRFVENIIDFVKKDLGVSLLMDKLVDKNSQGIKAIPITPKVSANINLCFLKNSHKNKEKDSFINYINNY